MLAGYIARRLLGAIPVLLGVTVVVFLCMQLVPGDIAKALLGPLATQEAVEEFRRYLGLDRPIPEQYVNWLGRALRGDLGRSFSSNMRAWRTISTFSALSVGCFLATVVILVKTSFQVCELT